MDIQDFLACKQAGCALVLKLANEPEGFETSLEGLVSSSRVLNHVHDTNWCMTNIYKFDPGISSTVSFDESRCEISCKSTTTNKLAQAHSSSGSLELIKDVVVSPPSYVNLSSINSVSVQLFRDFTIVYETLGIDVVVRYTLTWTDDTYEAAERMFLSDTPPTKSVEASTSSVSDLGVQVLNKIGLNLCALRPHQN